MLAPSPISLCVTSNQRVENEGSGDLFHVHAAVCTLQVPKLQVTDHFPLAKLNRTTTGNHIPVNCKQWGTSPIL